MQLGDKGVRHLSYHVPQLRALYLQGCTRLTDESFRHLALLLRLQVLDLLGCKGMHGIGVARLSSLSDLRMLDGVWDGPLCREEVRRLCACRPGLSVYCMDLKAGS